MITAIRKNLVTKKYEVTFELTKKNFLHHTKIAIFGDFNNWGDDYFELEDEKKARYKSKYIFPKQGVHGNDKTRELTVELDSGTYQFKYFKIADKEEFWMDRKDICPQDQDGNTMRQFGVTWVGNGLGNENLVLTLY